MPLQPQGDKSTVLSCPKYSPKVKLIPEYLSAYGSCWPGDKVMIDKGQDSLRNFTICVEFCANAKEIKSFTFGGAGVEGSAPSRAPWEVETMETMETATFRPRRFGAGCGCDGNVTLSDGVSTWSWFMGTNSWTEWDSKASKLWKRRTTFSPVRANPITTLRQQLLKWRSGSHE